VVETYVPLLHLISIKRSVRGMSFLEGFNRDIRL
jgi:hypothetical protein